MRTCFLLLALFLALTPAVRAQNEAAPCGVVDAIDYPIDGLVEGYDDFALYRPRFGGNHTGLDIGFGRWGDPVRAAARGRVTYSDPEGWDTEKGVVIVEHTFPDGSIAYSVYGHMEQTDTLFFPPVGSCVERGDVLGGIGWPSRGRPHLHYEIRDFLPNDGGPGYVTGNPLLEGWYHPLDFTQLWRVRLSPAFISHVTFDQVPALPPIVLESGLFVIASGNVIEGVGPLGELVWRVETDGVVIGLAGLAGNRVVAHTRNGQAMTLQGGRYAALWTVYGPDVPFVTLGETLVFATQGGGLAAYDPLGKPLWDIPATDTAASVVYFQSNGTQVALGLRLGGQVLWRLINSTGEVVYETHFDGSPTFAPLPGEGWLVLNGTQLEHVVNGERQALASISPPAGRTARIAADRMGNSYIYLGDAGTTLLALDAAGDVRWRTDYIGPRETLPPLLRLGNGCLLYTLDVDGTLNVFSTADGALLNQLQLYAGGAQTGSPRARLLSVDQDERVWVGSGFLSLVTLDGRVLGGEAAASCRLG